MSEEKTIKELFGYPIVLSDDSPLKSEQDIVFEDVIEHFRNQVSLIMDQREEILTAFIAKYNCQPDEIVQIITTTNKGEEWRVELKSDRKTKQHDRE